MWGADPLSQKGSGRRLSGRGFSLGFITSHNTAEFPRQLEVGHVSSGKQRQRMAVATCAAVPGSRVPMNPVSPSSFETSFLQEENKTKTGKSWQKFHALCAGPRPSVWGGPAPPHLEVSATSRYTNAHFSVVQDRGGHFIAGINPIGAVLMGAVRRCPGPLILSTFCLGAAATETRRIKLLWRG